MNNTKRFALDTAMLAAVLMLMNPVFTGIEVHIWLGLALLLPALLHTALNWDWAMRSIDRLFEKIRGASRVKLALGALLFISFVTVTLSGAMVVPAVANSFIAAYAAWHALHVLSSWTFAVLALVHLAMHGRWIAGVIGRALAAPSTEGALR